MKTFTDKKQFFKFTNNFDGELIVRKNDVFNSKGEKIAEYKSVTQ